MVNPYNHHSAIRSREKFCDREHELDEIEYYLDQATEQRPSFYNIGITGPEGVGKSSLCNIIEARCADKNILPVRIDLNNEIVDNGEELFKYILEIGSEKQEETKGALIEKTLSQYIDKLELNFKFLKIYLDDGENNSQISSRMIRNDLKELYEYIRRPAICVILDDAHILSQNELVLQRLRNIFSNIEGYILLLSGPEDMFEQISDTFDPLARHFTSVNISNFNQPAETRECLVKPLPDEERDRISAETANEVHKITGGSPYEINLVGHYMYRICQREGTSNLELTNDVLETVIKQISNWKRVGDEEILTYINNMTKTQMLALSYLSTFEYCEKERLIDTVTMMMISEHEQESQTDILNQSGNPPHERSQQIHEKVRREVSDLLDSDIIIETEDGFRTYRNEYLKTYVRYTAASKNMIPYAYLWR